MSNSNYAPLWSELKQCGNKNEVISLLFSYLREKGQSNYDESVTQYEHAVQAAALAVEAKVASSSVAASLVS